MVSFTLLIGLLFLLLQTEAFQTWLARRVTGYLSSELNAEVDIHRVSIRFFDKAVLEDVFVADPKGDTLFYFSELMVNVKDLSFEQKRMELSKITLKDAYFNLVHTKGEQHDNLHFLTEYFSTPDTTVSDTSKWKVKFKDIELRNFRFHYDDWNEPEEKGLVDFSHLDVSKASGFFHNLRFVNDSIFTVVDQLSFIEKSGFTVNDFSADAKVSGHEIRTTGLHIHTPRTELAGDLDFDYDSWDDFSDFIHKVKWNGNFNPSRIDFRDIAFFTDELKGLDKYITVKGRVKGTVDRFKGKDMTLSWGEKAAFAGNVFFEGLPDIDETYMDIMATDLKVNTKDLEWIQLPPFDSGAHILLPENLDLLGDVTFKGKFTGFITDFVAYGNVQTAIGYVSSDINLKFDKQKKAYAYNGSLSTNDFDVGKITLTPGLSFVTMNADVKGSGFQLNNINATAKGTIGKLTYNGYPYRNIAVEGTFAKKLFSGTLAIHEPDVDLDFNGEIDMSGRIPVFDFNASIGRLQLNQLNFIQNAIPYTLKSEVKSHLTGNQIDNLEGTIDITNTFLQTGPKMYHLNALSLLADKDAGGKRTIQLYSDLLDARISGEFMLAALPAAFREIIPRYLPNVMLPVKGDAAVQDFDFDIHFKNMSAFTENFIPELYVDPSSHLKGEINSIDRNFDIAFSSPDFRYDGIRLSELNVRLAAENNAMKVAMKADTLFYSGSGYVPDYILTAYAMNNKVDFLLRLADQERQSNKLRWSGHCDFRSYNDATLIIDTSNVVIDAMPWQILEGNRVDFNKEGVHLQQIGLRHDTELVAINGWVSRDSTRELGFQFNDFSIAHLNSALNAINIKLAGAASGNASLSELYGDLQLKTDLKVSGLVINGDTVGNASFITGYDTRSNSFVVKADVIKGSAKIIDIEGRYYFSNKENAFDFTIKTDNFYLHSLENLTDGLVSDLRGKVNMDLRLTGTPERPVLDGFADFRKAAATVTYLNTRYNFSSRVEVHENLIDLNGVKLYDRYGQEASIKGVIRHTYFSAFKFDVEVYPKNFEILNTQLFQNSLYYGNAIATGFVKLSGLIDDFQMDIAISPDKGTVINIPLNTASEVSASDFITFVDKRIITDFEDRTNTVNLSGLRLNMSLDMNPNAEINLIFDEKIGDVISGNGNGNLRMDINTIGDFNMYGTYTIEKGTYLFTLQNLINKRFKIDQGGRITWGGDPYDANIDMTAVYTVSTSSLYNLIQDSTFQRRLPVECRLNLSNKLMNPTINYEIAVKAQDPTIESMVRTVLNSEQEVNRQMFGLLVFNQFLPPSVGASSTGRLDAGAGAVASASELLSNQVSNWLSQLSKDVNIGFNYRAKDSYSNEEIQLMFSKSMFNDRLLVETNVGVMGANAAATNTSSNSIVGEFYTEYKVSKDGRFRLKAYNKSNVEDLINYNSPYTQGVGVFFRQDFNSISDLKERLGLTRKNKDLPEKNQ